MFDQLMPNLCSLALRIVELLLHDDDRIAAASAAALALLTANAPVPDAPRSPAQARASSTGSSYAPLSTTSH